MDNVVTLIASYDDLQTAVQPNCDESDSQAAVDEKRKKKIARKIGKMKVSGGKCIVELMVYSYQTVLLMWRIATEIRIRNVGILVEMGLHVLACMISCLCVHGDQSLLFHIVTFPKPLRYFIKRIVGRKELAFIKKEEQINHDDVLSERSLKSVAKYCVLDLNCKRADLIVSLVISLPMGVLKAYMEHKTGQLDNHLTFAYLLISPIAYPLIITILLGYIYYKSKYDCEWIIEIGNGQENRTGLDIV